jgi:hypothetical protein
VGYHVFVCQVYHFLDTSIKSDTPDTQIHDNPLSWLGLDTSIKSDTPYKQKWQPTFLAGLWHFNKKWYTWHTNTWQPTFLGCITFYWSA